MSKAHHDCETTARLLPLEDVLDKLLAADTTLPPTELIEIEEALNRTLSEDLLSEIDVPPHDNSAVDGYVCALEDYREGQSIPVSARIPAGTHPETLAPGTAARIFTGATIPTNGTCVVMQENCRVLDNGDVVIESAPSLGQNIRRAGQDIKSGNRIIAKGTRLSPQHLGLIASVGIATVSVYKPLTVAILSTGDELIEPGKPLAPSQIYNSNRYLLKGLLNQFGFQMLDLGIVEDTLDATKEALARASKNADVILSTGGASVGEEDHIQNAIKALGEIDFWRIAIKPGKPFMFGRVAETPVLGLPGNPGAAFVTFLILARPFLLKSQGMQSVGIAGLSAKLGFDILKPGKRREFLRVKYQDGELVKYDNQSSGMLSSTTWADGLAVITENQTFKRGDIIDYLPFSALLSGD